MKDIDTEVMEIIGKVVAVAHDDSALDRSTSLLGDPLGMDGCDLVYIVLELMERFQITFTREDFENYGFSTPDGIINAVKRHAHHA